MPFDEIVAVAAVVFIPLVLYLLTTKTTSGVCPDECNRAYTDLTAPYQI